MLYDFEGLYSYFGPYFKHPVKGIPWFSLKQDIK
jgi:hypothetical protein